MELVPMQNTLKALIKYKNQPVIFSLISDQTPTKSESTYWTKFLNQDTLVFLGAEKLAKLTNYPVIYFDIHRLKRGFYEIEFVKLFDNPKITSEFEITEKHVRFLEKTIREKPQDWLWSHKRWKHKKI